MKVVNRIKKSQDFIAPIRKGHAYKNQSFVIHVINNGFTVTRVGISVSAKLGNAVIRNRIKRQIRAICDSLIDYDAQHLDIVVVAKQPFLENTFNQNKELLKSLLILGIGNTK